MLESELGTKKGALTLNHGVVNLLSGLFGNKTISVEVYENGIILGRKNGSETILFEEIKKIKTFNFFAPLSTAISIELFNNHGEKLAALSLPPDKKDAYMLLEAHRDFQLGKAFPDNLETLSVDLGGLQLENGNITEVVKKETISYPLADIQDFVYNKGLFYFTVKGTDDKLAVFMDNADNCLSTIEIGKIIMERSRPKNLF